MIDAREAGREAISRTKTFLPPPKTMNTQIFDTHSDFLAREDKNINGVTQVFALLGLLGLLGLLAPLGLVGLEK